MDTLTTARQKAMEISLSVASMNHIHDIIQGVDELLEILTGDKVLTNVPLFKQIQPPPPPSPTTVILEILEKHRTSMTLYRICKETTLDKETALSALNQLLAQAKITSPKKRGHKQYIRVYHNTRT